MRFVSRILVVFVLLLLAGPVARAEKTLPTNEQPMKVVVVRSSDSSCEPLCPEWIMAEGQITAETPALFDKVFLSLGGARLPVIIHSPGGSIVAAIQIGYDIRARKLDVGVGRTNYDGCSPFGPECKPGTSYRGTLVSYRAYCLSACPLILASGSARLAGLDAVVGVHQWQFYKAPGLSANAKKTVSANRDPGWDIVVRKMITDFLGKMGNSLSLPDDMEKAPFTSINLIDMKRRRSLDLITRTDGAQSMVSRGVCAAFPPASHCMFGGGDAAQARSYAEALRAAGVPLDGAAMTVAVVRNPGRDCEPVCPQWIAAQGVITPATPKLLAKTLKGIGKTKLPVLIDSPGGDLDAALEMARLIAKRGLDVAVAGTGYSGCKPSEPVCKRVSPKAPYTGIPIYSGQHCNGVCVLILAAGKQRFANGDGVVEIHNPGIYLSRRSAGPASTLMSRFFAETQTADGILTVMAKLGKGARQPLTEAALLKSGTITSAAPAEAAFSPDNCRRASPPPFCVKQK